VCVCVCVCVCVICKACRMAQLIETSFGDRLVWASDTLLDGMHIIGATSRID